MQIVGLWALLLVLFQTDAVTQDAPVPRFEYTPSLGCGDVFFHARNSAEAEILRIEVDVAQARRSASEQVFDLAALPTGVVVGTLGARSRGPDGRVGSMSKPYAW